jgi:hypothetical protein
MISRIFSKQTTEPRKRNQLTSASMFNVLQCCVTLRTSESRILGAILNISKFVNLICVLQGHGFNICKSFGIPKIILKIIRKTDTGILIEEKAWAFKNIKTAGKN